MKKLIALILSPLILCTAACSSNSNTESLSTTEQTTIASTEVIAANLSPQEKLEETLENFGFEGVVYATKDGKLLASFAKGTLENGDAITIDTPMPLGSVSKQFCAAAILLLQEQGKLSVDDTLDKYFPEYQYADKITLHNMLSMRSGISGDLHGDGIEEKVTLDHTDEENTAAIKEWIFNHPLDFEPGSMYTYSNSNYMLLGNIVEQVSGEKYIDFLRENLFTPLGMTHTGSIGELSSSPEWAMGIPYENVDAQPGLTKGAGDLISNGADMTLWMNGLRSGKIISAESYKAMTTDYSSAPHYGYGLELEVMSGVGHGGVIRIYNSYDYINEHNDFTLFIASNNSGPSTIKSLLYNLLQNLMIE